MPALASATPAPASTPYRLVDLDAGTTLPRAVWLAGAALLIAGVAAWVLAVDQERPRATRATGPRVDAPAVVVPAYRSAWAPAPKITVPAGHPIGPSASLLDPHALLAMEPGAGGIGQ